MKLLSIFSLFFSFHHILAEEEIYEDDFSLFHHFAERTDFTPAVECPVVKTLSGSLRGRVRYSYLTKRLYCSYLNIPYAKPPVGPLRFQAPVPYGKWMGVKACDERNIYCPQMKITGEVIGDEDCLVLHVYVPAGCGNCALPVLVFIRGGGFVMGAGFKFGAEKLMDHCMIVVTFNYRLSILGGLNTKDENSHGNYHLLDQALALKWVHNNIASFGGDPKQVTLWGHSAGSASVVYHILSNYSQGLFARAYCMSGSPLFNTWAYQSDPVGVAEAVARNLNCGTTNKTKMVQCLRSKTTKELLIGFNKLTLFGFFPPLCGPSIEPISGPGFLRQSPLDLLMQNKIANRVPVRISGTSCAGFTSFDVLNLAVTIRGREYFNSLQFADHLKCISTIKNASVCCRNAIFNRYCGSGCNVNDSAQFANVLQQIVGDAMYNVGNTALANLLAKNGISVCVHRNTYVSSACYMELFGFNCSACTADADDLFYYMSLGNLTSTAPNDVLMSSIVISDLYDFVSQSCSNCLLCKKYDPQRPSYLNVALGDFSNKDGTLTDNFKFWTEDVFNLCP